MPSRTSSVKRSVPFLTRRFTCWPASGTGPHLGVFTRAVFCQRLLVGSRRATTSWPRDLSAFLPHSSRCQLSLQPPDHCLPSVRGRPRCPSTRGSQVGSHHGPTPSHMEPIKAFDSLALSGTKTRPDTSSDAGSLVRIEGVRGSNPLSSTRVFAG